MGDTVRIGKVSSINGFSVRVTYPDRDDTVTEELPLVTNGVFRIPAVDELVVIVHMSNGTTGGFCLGGLGQGNNDYQLTSLLTRLSNLENRLTDREGRG